MATTTKRAPRKAAPKKAAPKATGRGPVTPDGEIVRWIKAESAKARKAGTKVTTAGLLRTWRAQGGKANPKRFAALVNATR